MRTTLSIDDDVLAAARERAARERKSVGAVLSQLAREALTGRGASGPPPTSGRFYGFEPFPSRGAAVTNTLINSLREDEPE